MAHRSDRRRRTQQTAEEDPGTAPETVHPSIARLRGTHRAAHPDEGTILSPTSHVMMLREWPITCPRMLDMLHRVGLDTVAALQYIRLDHHMLTALVERWSPDTNSFHLPVGEITITLQDVGVLLGLCIDGLPFIGPNVIGATRRWPSWPECCDDLLGAHPLEDVTYHHPVQPHITSSFRMGQSKS